jgi:hypothetical protein
VCLNLDKNNGTLIFKMQAQKMESFFHTPEF